MTDWKDQLSSDPAILFGKLVVMGTRIPVELILEKLASNYSFQDLLQAYPRLTIPDIQACLSYAADTDEEVLAIAVSKNALLLTEDKDFGELVFN